MTSADLSGASTPVSDATKMEIHGVDYMPADQRSSRPRDIFFAFLGSEFALGIIVLGQLPISLGLGWWQAVSAITVGTGVGCLLVSPLAHLGPVTGTSGSVASGAHFGVRGRMIGGLLSVFISLIFYSLTIWTGGEAVVAGVSHLLGTELSGANAAAIGAVIICALSIGVALYGHDLIVATQTAVSYGIGIAILAMAIAVFPHFNAGFAGGSYTLGSFWPTWFLSATVCASLPISYAPFVNDYSRYMREDLNQKSLFWGTFGGMFLGCWIAFAFGAYIATFFTDPNAPFVSGTIAIMPVWCVPILILVGLIGSQPQGSLCLYTGGLGLQSLSAKLGRIQATAILSLISLVMVFIGIYLINMVDFLLVVLAPMEVLAAPWIAVNLVGHYLVLRKRYQPLELFTYETGGGGLYWYSNGFNRRGIAAWVIGSLAGMMFINTAAFAGPLSTLAGGVPLDLLTGFITAGITYFLIAKPPQSA